MKLYSVLVAFAFFQPLVSAFVQAPKALAPKASVAADQALQMYGYWSREMDPYTMPRTNDYMYRGSGYGQGQGGYVRDLENRLRDVDMQERNLDRRLGYSSSYLSPYGNNWYDRNRSSFRYGAAGTGYWNAYPNGSHSLGRNHRWYDSGSYLSGTYGGYGGIYSSLSRPFYSSSYDSPRSYSSYGASPFYSPYMEYYGGRSGSYDE